MLKSCLKQPISEIFEASRFLDLAATAHLNEDVQLAEELIIKADMPIIRDWTESIWGLGGIFSEFKKILGDPPTVQKEERDILRMPDKIGKQNLLIRDGFYCRFCGIPVIRKEIRETFKKHYPNSLKWGAKNSEQHAAFQAMWVQYDHLIPHARGGKTSLDNMLITCGPCNYGRMNYLIEEVGLNLPLLDSIKNVQWDGLERILK